MTNLFYIMGKSATGKDTIYKKIKEQMNINEYILYTTRPKRDGEEEGVNYHYVSIEQMNDLGKEGKVIESRVYHTVHGPWIYATVNDDQLKQEGNILTVGTLESYNQIMNFFMNKEDTEVFPIYIAIDEEERRKRAIEREEKQKEPKYAEMERRLKADNLDFSEEKLRKAGITKDVTFYNYDLDKCVDEILKYIEKSKSIDKKNKENKEIIDEER